MSAKLLTALGTIAWIFNGALRSLISARGNSRTPGRANNWASFTQVYGLSKLEAEELLDSLEAHNIDECQASYQPGEGFTVFRR